LINSPMPYNFDKCILISKDTGNGGTYGDQNAITLDNIHAQ